LQKLKLISRSEALRQIHFPASQAMHEQAVRRLKFEELFISQLRLAMVRMERHRRSKGVIFKKWVTCSMIFTPITFPFSLRGRKKEC
jgi:ATP-dependent DNA helicase RecG